MRKTLRLNDLKTRTAMNVKISMFVICVEGIIYFLYIICMTAPLTNTPKSSKVYWLLLKTFLDNKKIPLIPLLVTQR